MSKYFNRKTVYKGITYDSKHEAQKAYEFEMLQRSGYICHLERQRRFELQQSFKRNGKTERAITYIADFYYYDNRTKKWVVVDAKSAITKTLPVYRIKKKLFMFKYPDIDFIEV